MTAAREGLPAAVIAQAPPQHTHQAGTLDAHLMGARVALNSVLSPLFRAILAPQMPAQMSLGEAGQTEVAATWAATTGDTSTAPAKPLPRSTGTISTSIPGSGAWIIWPWPM